MSGERYVLTGDGGTEQELTSAEARQLRRDAGDFTARAEASGLVLDDSTAQATPWLYGLRQALPSEGLTVLLDTTTIFNAGQALHVRGWAPSPIWLLDLSVLTSAAILFDTIVIQPERFPALEDIRDLTQVLEPTAEGQAELERIYGGVWETFSQPEQPWSKRWGEFLAVEPRDLPFNFEAVRTLNAEMLFDYSSTAEIAEAFGTAGRFRNPDALAVALGIHTVRTGFNDKIAAVLGLPYMATSVRLPVSSDLVDRKTHLLWVLGQLIARSSPPGTPELATFAPRTPIAAPMLLGLVLERMTKPEDYRGALDEIRERFAPLRAKLREDRGASPWDKQPPLYVQRFTKHLAGMGATFAGAQDAAIATAQAGATLATGDPGFVTAALKVIAATKPLEYAHRLYLRWWKPEIYVLLNVAREASRLSLLDNRIRQVWGKELDFTEQRLLEHFASLRAGPFLTPTALT
jgi:hypothetical protein